MQRDMILALLEHDLPFLNQRCSVQCHPPAAALGSARGSGASIGESLQKPYRRSTVGTGMRPLGLTMDGSECDLWLPLLPANELSAFIMLMLALNCFPACSKHQPLAARCVWVVLYL